MNALAGPFFHDNVQVADLDQGNQWLAIGKVLVVLGGELHARKLCSKAAYHKNGPIRFQLELLLAL